MHNDHLNTPRKITNSADAVVFDWSADDPFGGNTPSVNTIGFNVRYPGQYYDSETGWHYNMNRYYNPKSGKYTQPDPIGLGGGLNMYNYVQGNSLNYYDEDALSPRDIERLRALFQKGVKEMVDKKMRLPGNNGNLFNDNNQLAYRCNPQYSSTWQSYIPGFSSCNDKKDLLVCYDQTEYILYNMFANDINQNKNQYDDKWDFERQESWSHSWGVGRSSIGENIWFDAWKNEFSITPQNANQKPLTRLYK